MWDMQDAMKPNNLCLIFMLYRGELKGRTDPISAD
jgi:hypothetical protein